MFIIFGLLIIVILIGVIVLLVYSMISGGPYAPVGYQRMKNMLDLVNIKKSDKAVDIGAGDGRIVIELAKRGAQAYGYEINPLLVWIARRKIKKAGLQKNAFMYTADIWKKNYSDFDVITIYMAPHIMERLQKKLKKELKKGGRIVMNHYSFPNWKPTARKGDVYLYSKKV